MKNNKLFDSVRDPVAEHYDLLIDEGNDPVTDSPALRKYMDKWDGQLFMDLISADPSKDILEIGCGTGRLAVRIAPLVRSYCGIDLSKKTLETAKSHLPLGNVTLIHGDFSEHIFDRKFDVIFSSLTFMHIKDKKKAISRTAELLRENGRFVLSIDKSRNTILDYGTRQLEIYPDTPEEIIGILKSQGFGNIEAHETEFAHIIAASI